MEALLQKNFPRVPDLKGAMIRLERAYEDLDDFDSLVEGVAQNIKPPALLAFTHLPYIAKLLFRDPTRLSRLLDSAPFERLKTKDEMSKELLAMAQLPLDEASLKKNLRKYRADELSRLALKEFCCGKAVEVGVELSDLASVSLQFAIDFYVDHFSKEHGPPMEVADDKTSKPATLVVFGMGKLGGAELNFCSDIDLIYMYSSDEGSAGELSLHEFFSKVCKKVSAALHEKTEDDHIFRVDLRLRPEGSQGPIANSFASMERYYETFGRPWERQAWLKARPVAGDLALGVEMLDTLKPFIHSRSISNDIIGDVKDLNQQIKAQSSMKGLDDGFDVKNGKGGIREIEFFVQSLQLIHSGHYQNIRSKSTRNALQQLFSVGLIDDKERVHLLDAYNFLRSVEHLLQLESGRQTQRLPKEPERLEHLAMRMGFEDNASFQAALQNHCKKVWQLFETLGVDEPSTPADVKTLLTHQASSDETVEIFRKRHYQSPERAALIWARVRSIPGCPLGPAASSKSRHLAPKFMEALMTAPDKDAALSHAVDLMARSKIWSSVWRLIDDHPPILQLVASVFGTSQFLSRILVSNPEQFNALIVAGKKGPVVSAERLSKALQNRFTGIDDDDEEAYWNTLAAFKNNQLMRIGISDIGGLLEIEELTLELSKVADLAVHQALKWSKASLTKRFGHPRTANDKPSQFAVLAMGKLGGKELSYASDLDLVFIYDGEGETDGDKSIDTSIFMTKLAQRLMRQLSTTHITGRLYEIDTRLRPSGSKGMLVSSLGRWIKYHSSSARIWERQSITKLRFIAGDEELGQKCIVASHDAAYRNSVDAADLAKHISEMRLALEKEAKHAKRNFKVGKGGLVDIEFIAQYLQLLHGSQHSALKTQNTLQALRASETLGLLDKTDTEDLVAGYLFLRTIEMRARLFDDRSHQFLPDNENQTLLLIRKIGYQELETFDSEYTRLTHNIRRLFKKIVGQLNS